MMEDVQTVETISTRQLNDALRVRPAQIHWQRKWSILCVAVVALQRQVPIIVSSSFFDRLVNLPVAIKQERSIARMCCSGHVPKEHCGRPYSVATTRACGSEVQKPVVVPQVKYTTTISIVENTQSSFPLLVFLYMHSYPAWSWGEQSNMCFEVPMKRDLMALVRAQEEALDFMRLQLRWQLRLTAGLRSAGMHRSLFPCVVLTQWCAMSEYSRRAVLPSGRECSRTCRTGHVGHTAKVQTTLFRPWRTSVQRDREGSNLDFKMLFQLSS